MHPQPRARPVAEAPVDALLTRVEELAKRWAIALILALPLERIGEIPLEDLAREAPALCARVVRALESEAELERMTGGGDASGRGGHDEETAPVQGLAALVGARDAGSTVQAVEALRGVLWETLLSELHDPRARAVADLSDRLAYVCSAILIAAIPMTVAPDEAVVAHVADGATGASERKSSGQAGVVLVDEREEREDVPARSSAVSRAPLDPSAEPEMERPQTRPRPLPWDTPSEEMRVTRGSRSAVGRPIVPADDSV
jgi:hypothetical protein